MLKQTTGSITPTREPTKTTLFEKESLEVRRTPSLSLDFEERKLTRAQQYVN